MSDFAFRLAALSSGASGIDRILFDDGLNDRRNIRNLARGHCARGAGHKPHWQCSAPEWQWLRNTLQSQLRSLLHRVLDLIELGGNSFNSTPTRAANTVMIEYDPDRLHALGEVIGARDCKVHPGVDR